ncbi:MAG: hypothetical protein ACRC0X_06575, partial [Brevinema sp.]
MNKYHVYFFVFIAIISFSSRTTKIYGQNPFQEDQVYKTGTGFSLNYFDYHVGMMIDSLHFFNDDDEPFHKALLKIGMGFNYNVRNLNLKFIFSTSIGYIYIQDQFYSKIKKLGIGFTIDYQLVDLIGHSIGTSIHLVLDRYILGFGGGATLIH